MLNKTDNEELPLFASATSSIPSLLKSAITLVRGDAPDEKSVFAANVGVDAPGVVVFKNIEMELGVRFVVIKSNFPSPFISPVESE